jgi:crotonobetainyl-CoA:carnitine CoA-transferase CaiB-like acyl-CoA transferase
MNSNGAYPGLRMLDLGQSVAAPYCAMLLATRPSVGSSGFAKPTSWQIASMALTTGSPIRMSSRPVTRFRVSQPEMGQFQTPRTPGVALAVDAAMTPAPRIGEHGAAILSELGIDPKTIAQLQAENILLIPEAP